MHMMGEGIGQSVRLASTDTFWVSGTSNFIS